MVWCVFLRSFGGCGGCCGRDRGGACGCSVKQLVVALCAHDLRGDDSGQGAEKDNGAGELDRDSTGDSTWSQISSTPPRRRGAWLSTSSSEAGGASSSTAAAGGTGWHMSRAEVDGAGAGGNPEWPYDNRTRSRWAWGQGM
eukprot:g18575.t1